MNTIRGRIDFAIPLPAAVDPPGAERLMAAVKAAHDAIGTFTAAIAGLGGSASYRPKVERKPKLDQFDDTGANGQPVFRPTGRSPALATVTDDHAGPALHGPSPTLDAGEVTLHDGEPGLAAQRLAAADHFNIPKVLRK